MTGYIKSLCVNCADFVHAEIALTTGLLLPGFYSGTTPFCQLDFTHNLDASKKSIYISIVALYRWRPSRSCKCPPKLTDESLRSQLVVTANLDASKKKFLHLHRGILHPGCLHVDQGQGRWLATPSDSGRPSRRQGHTLEAPKAGRGRRLATAAASGRPSRK